MPVIPLSKLRAGWRGLSPKSPVVWLSGLLILVLVGWGSVSLINAALKPDGCTRRTAVQIAAVPSVAEAVAEIAQTGTDDESCVDITVVAKDSAAFADALANPPPGAQPHAWLPESSYWLGRARARGAFAVPERGTSVGSSPVVLAMTEPVAAQLGWPDKPIGWAALLGPGNSAIPVGLPDPAADPTGIAALLGVQAVTAGLPDPKAAQTAVLRRLTRYTVARAADLFAKLPEAGSAAGTLNAFITSEQALLRHNAGKTATPLVASYPETAVPALDFPYVVLPGAGKAELDGATRFLSRLLSPDGRRHFGASGVRAPDGAPAEFRRDPSPAANRVRTEAVAPVAMPAEADLGPLLSAWTGVHLSARILGVLDVSGSMAERLPNGDTRLTATVRAMQEGLGLLLDTTELGFWIFSTRLDGDRDYKVLAPPRPLGEQRGALAGQLGQVRVKPDGDTGLYDTTLAAYQDARRNWIPGRINVVMIATDGKNDDAQSISRPNLIAELRKLTDPRRPLPIIFIGIGGGIDPAELNEISGATGGKVFLAPDPSAIKQIFFTALADLACQPPACRR